MTTRGSRSEKVKRISQQFDLNRDGGLNRKEIYVLVGDFIDTDKGLTFYGLLRTYVDDVGDVDRDFESLTLEMKPDDDKDNNNTNNELASSMPFEDKDCWLTWRLLDC
ncbi:hypothetical protein L2E82_14492 [Cichorium intybus]|uniref:Uncharacterized protein n=1 Tax=Cichorium intybus TaxID=13427 RepID=A0ACB9EZJ6_CICIN|nr:hypothetical protein L2E82_14492 [Cichorium intybus]